MASRRNGVAEVRGTGEEWCVGLVRRPQVTRLVMRSLEAYGVAVLCAGAGMGKTCAALLALDELRSRGWEVRRVELGGLAAREAASRGRAAVEDARGGDGRHALLLDGVPPLREDEARGLAGRVRAAAASGVRVVLTMRPEAETVCASLDVPCLRSRHLLVTDEERTAWGIPSSSLRAEAAFEGSRGVPALVRFLRDAGGSVPDDARGRLEALGLVASLAGAATHDRLPARERRLRLAMVLLGRGTLRELEDVAGRLEGERAAALQRDEPLFGVDVASASFALADFGLGWAAAAFDGLLRSAALEQPDVVLACALELAERGEHGRAGSLAAFCEEGARRRFALEWPAELIDAGYASLVEEACGGSDPAHALGRLAARMTLASLRGDDAAYERARSCLPSPAGSRERTMLRQAEAAQAARLVRAGRRAAKAAASSEGDRIEDMLMVHVAAYESLCQGRLMHAYRLLLSACDRPERLTLSSALVWQDLVLVRCLLGETPDEEERPSSSDVLRFFLEADMRDHLLYSAALVEAMRGLFGPGADRAALERGLACASRRGDVVPEVATLLVLGALDAGEGSLARAHVRLGRARELALRIGCGRLADSAGLLDAVALRRLGDGAPLARLREEGGGAPRLLAAVAGAALDGDASGLAAAFRGAGDRAIPAEEVPLVRVLLGTLGEGAAEVVADHLPQAWSDRLARFDSACAARFSPAKAPADPAGRGDDVLSVRLLGGFRVERGGERIGEDRWKRTAAKQLLMLLAVAENHTLSRSELIEAIWPATDFLRGRTNLYTALSTLRKVLGGGGDGERYVVGHGNELSLDPARVRCDVDEFSEACRALLSTGGTGPKALSAARRAREAYGGDLYVPPSDATGTFVRRREELARSYVDAMLFGTEAALRAGEALEASCFSEEAWRRDPMREDVVMARISALAASGRLAEAREAYEAYASRSVEETGVPPSARLREAATRIGGVASDEAEPLEETVVLEG